MIQVLICGAGQLGSRYLQGLVRCSIPLNIYVFDIHQGALALARQRWGQAIATGCPHRVSYLTSLDGLPARLDLVIVATNADVRAKAVAGISEQSSVRFWILEKVLAQCLVDLDHLHFLTKRADGTWVNIPYRMMAWHQRMRAAFSNDRLLKVCGNGGLWGLACNSVHFLDLVAWWTGEELISVDISELEEDWIESKRLGFYEAVGILKARYSKGSELALESRFEAAPFRLHVENEEGQWLIDHGKGVVSGPNGIKILGNVEYQSHMTARLVQEILETSCCDLPTFGESVMHHRIFLQAMLDHWNRSHGRTDSLVPIT